MKSRAWRPKPQSQGSALVYTVFLLTLAGVAVIAITLLVNENLRNSKRSEDRLQAFYAAEAGVQEVVDWFNRGYFAWLGPTLPENNDADQGNNIALHDWSDGAFDDATFRQLFAPDAASGRYLDASRNSVFAARLQAAGLAELRMEENYPDFIYFINNSNNDLQGRVVELLVEPPVTSGPGADAAGTVARVTCVGESVSGVRSTVEVRLLDNPVTEIAIPAALMSETTAASNGQFNVHWGEIWTKGNLELTNNITKFPTRAEDRWFMARAEGMLVDGARYADGRDRSGLSNTPIPSSAANYRIPYLEATLNSRIHRSYHDRENLTQHATGLQWPEYDYDTMKMIAQRMGWPIYRTTAGGKLLVPNPETGRMEEKSFEQVFNLESDPDDIDPDEMPPMYFIDTIDGNPPRADGTNMTKLKISGGGPFFYGMFFIAANIEFGGSGNSPQFDTPLKPDGTIGGAIRDCRVRGLLYLYGSGDFQGQGEVYGALYAERGFTGGGTWDIWYDQDMQNPVRNRIQSRLRVRLWNTF